MALYAPFITGKINRERIQAAMDKSSGKKPRIFISHSSKDNTFGKRIVQDLRYALGDDDAVWYDTQGGLNGGDDWWGKIVQEIKQRNIFILIVSPEAMQSEWIRREFVMAFTEGKRIIPLFHRKCEIWTDLKIIQVINFLSPVTYQASFEELMKAIGAPQRKKKPPSAQGTLHFIYDIHTSWVGSIAWAPDGSRIASGGGDGTVRVWDAYTGETLRTYRGHQGPLSEVWSIIWSPNSNTIASAGNRSKVQVWNPLNGQKIAIYRGHSFFLPTVSRMAWSPDGDYIASTNIGSSIGDAAIHIWNAYTGKKTKVIRLLSLSLNISLISGIGGIAWSPDGKYTACGIRREVRIYEASTGKYIQTYGSQTGEGGHYDTIDVNFQIGWSSDGKRISCANLRKVEIWNTETGKLLQTYIDHQNDIRAMEWSPDGKYIATGSDDKTVQIWDPDTGTRIFIYRGHKDKVTSLTWSPDSTRIASACKDGTVHVWQAV